MRSVLALDIGGTKLVAALVSSDGNVRGRRGAATRAEDGVDEMIERAMDLARAVLEEEEGKGKRSPPSVYRPRASPARTAY